MSPPRSGGFTMIELLVVISIIAVLAAIALPAYGLIKAQQKRAESKTLLNGISLALSSYLADHGILGDLRDADASDFRLRPLEFLVARPMRLRRDAYLELKPSQCARQDGSRCEASVAEVLLDPFANPVRFEATNARAKGRTSGPLDYTSRITLIATCGTIDDASDDIRLTYRHDTGEWAHEGR